MTRVYNFAAGPSMMPEPVLARIRDELPDWHGHGLSVMEMPFTGQTFVEIARAAVQGLKDLLALPEGYHVLFMHGGAMAQFAIVPLNLLRGRETADYVETGYWAGRAIKEARRYCEVHVAASGAPCGFTSLPPESEWRLDGQAAYCHITTNETVNGTEFHWTPETGAVPLVADMTSNFLSRPIDVGRFGLVYASAQKNIGPSGLTLVVVREDLIGGAHPFTPSVFDYAVQAYNESMYNTPATFSIYVAGLVFDWIKDQGGLDAMDRASRRKSGKLYDFIDSSGFYHCPVVAAARSRMNVRFDLADGTLTGPFLDDARDAGLVNLKGHKATGGLRASLYNAMPEEGVDTLVDFMKDFARRHG
jgi:phosphoserine aminotransferase